MVRSALCSRLRRLAGGLCWQQLLEGWDGCWVIVQNRCARLSSDAARVRRTIKLPTIWRRAVISPAADQVAIRSVDWLSCDRLLACTGSSLSMLARSNTQCQCDACRHCRWTTRQPVARRQYARPTLAFPTLGGGYTTISDSALWKLSYADFKKNHEPGNPEPVHQQMAYSRMKPPAYASRSKRRI